MTILIVDDEPAILTLVSEFLRDEGYDVITASDGYQALKILDHTPIEAVLADVGIPGPLGTTVASKALASCSPPAVILMSGYGYSLPDCIKDRGILVFQKPIELNEIAANIREQLSRARA